MQPILVIGIGGTGATVVTGIKRKMLAVPVLDIPVQLRWIDIDTNGDAFGKAEELGLGFGELILLNGFRVADFVKHACTDDPYFPKWWNCTSQFYDLYPLVTPWQEEAHDWLHWFQKMGRRDRRLMLYYHYQKVKVILQKSIEAVLSRCDENTSPLVVLSASTCEGMSGVILDVAYLARHIFSMMGRPGHILGVFALENIFAEAFMHAQEQHIRSILNTVATVKEIQHFATTKYEFGSQGQIITSDRVEPFDGYWLTERIQNQSFGSKWPTDYFLEIASDLFEVSLSGNWTVPRKSKYVPSPLDTNTVADWLNWMTIYDKHLKDTNRPSPHISREFDR